MVREKGKVARKSRKERGGKLVTDDTHLRSCENTGILRERPSIGKSCHWKRKRSGEQGKKDGNGNHLCDKLAGIGVSRKLICEKNIIRKIWLFPHEYQMLLIGAIVSCSPFSFKSFFFSKKFFAQN